jgi:site-specific recombinase XerD
MPTKTKPIEAVSARSTLPPAIRAWEVYLQDQANSSHTVKAFSADMRLLASYLPADQIIGTISTNDLNNFLEWMVADKMRRARNGETRSYVLASLLLHTGIKKGELLALKTNHLDLEAPGGAILFVRYASPQNRYKERKIALPEEWVDAYEEYAEQYDLSQKLFPWSPRRLEYLLQDLGEAAGLKKQLSFLMCRWTCALNDLRGGMEENKVRQKLGVSEIQWRELGMKLSRLRAEEQLEMF